MNNNNNLKREESFEDKSKLTQKSNSEKYKEELKKKLTSIEKETKEMKLDPEQFKNNSLPLARIKKIMKSDDGVKMIAGEAPILFSKACELFIIDLAYLSWVHTVDSNRRTLQKSDIAEAISQTDYFDFLLDIVQESTKKKLQMYASGYDPSGVNALGPLENYGGFMPPNNPYMLMNNLNPSYPQNVMYQPNPSLNNSLTPAHGFKKENDKQSETPGNSLLNFNYNLGGNNSKPTGHK